MSRTGPKSPARALQRLRNIPGVGRDIGALATVAALGLVAAVVILSQMSFHWPWESQKYEFKAEFHQAVAVSPGNGQEVRIAGVKVGDIRDSEPTGHNTSLVTLSIDADHEIYDNATAILRPKNPLNEMYVEINPGGPPGKQLPPDGVLPPGQTERPIQPDEVLNHLDQRTQQGMASLLAESDVALAAAPRDLPAGLGATDTTLQKLRPVTEALATRRDKIQQLITSLSQVSSAVGRNDTRLTSLIDSTQQTLGTLANRDDKVGDSLDQLGGVTGSLRDAMRNTSALTGQANPLLDNLKQASGELPPALKRLQSMSGQLGATVDAAKPVVSKAGPVVADLRPLTSGLHGAFDQLKPVTPLLGYATAQIQPWMHDFAAMIYNTNSVFAVRDINGGVPRGHLTVDTQRPFGVPNVGDDQHHGFRQGGSPYGPYPAPGQGG